MSAETIEPGDHVFVGNGKVHWVVNDIGPRSVLLRSGMTGRYRMAKMEDLHLHSKGASNDHSDPR